MIKAVAFDADDTLVDTKNAVTAALTAVVAQLNEPELTVELFREDAGEHWHRMAEHQAFDIRTAATRFTLARVGREAETEALVEFFFEVRFANSRPLHGAVEVLEKLRGDYKVGYATNGNSRSERCGLTGMFDFELYAVVDGVPKKPSELFYRRMHELAGVPAGEIVYVGDNYEHDVVGPKSLGMRAVWLNRSGAGIPGEVQPDAVIDNLMDLPRILAG
ncbi:MAG TPA: HAD family hydrolase [Candidatus Limnocylindrales bacterium]|nr:HAD family hydrolase [Candidatus Limnocylindrales bacterium]